MVYEGEVHWFGSKNQCWGSIHKFRHADGSMGRVFVHYKHILPDGQEDPKFRKLSPGQKVQFEIGPGFPSERGTQAVNVRIVSADSSQGNGRTEGLLPEG